MDWVELLSKIFEVCIIPLLGVLTTFLVKFIQVKSAEIKETTNNELANKYIAMLTDTITDCVIATNQTYVEALKKAGTFDAAAQKAAFNMTCESVLSILTDDAKEYLTNAVGDLNAYITQKIEAEVNNNKK